MRKPRQELPRLPPLPSPSARAARSAAPAAAEPRIHPIVKSDYRVRMVAMLVVGLIPLFHFRGHPPMPALVGMVFKFVAHHVIAITRRGFDQLAA